MTQAEVRQKFIKANPGIRSPHGGYWYKCQCCGKWCGRPGRDKIKIPDADKMEVDHIVPWSMGGSDFLHNLQPLCRACNRNKSASMTMKDNMKAGVNAVIHPIDTLAGVGRKAFRQNKTLKALGLNKRK